MSMTHDTFCLQSGSKKSVDDKGDRIVLIDTLIILVMEETEKSVWEWRRVQSNTRRVRAYVSSGIRPTVSEET